MSVAKKKAPSDLAIGPLIVEIEDISNRAGEIAALVNAAMDSTDSVISTALLDVANRIAVDMDVRLNAVARALHGHRK